MERGKDKRKRGEKESDHQEARIKKRGREGEEVELGGIAEGAAEEEEVEEFFAILRRMQVAVKYFERGSNGEGWRAAVESVVGDGGREEEEEGVVKRGAEQDLEAAAAAVEAREEEERVVLDLNAAPPVKG